MARNRQRIALILLDRDGCLQRRLTGHSNIAAPKWRAAAFSDRQVGPAAIWPWTRCTRGLILRARPSLAFSICDHCSPPLVAAAPRGILFHCTRADPTPQDAMAVLSPFAKPGADLPTLSKALRRRPPTTRRFEPAGASKVEAVYTPALAGGQLVIKPNEGQTESSGGGKSADVRAWNDAAQKNLPGGWAKMTGQIKDGHTLFRFKL